MLTGRGSFQWLLTDREQRSRISPERLVFYMKVGAALGLAICVRPKRVLHDIAPVSCSIGHR